MRVCNGKSGELIVDTDALSIQGMERMAAVFAHAARMAYNELDMYWRKEQEQLMKRREHTQTQ